LTSPLNPGNKEFA
jgi:4-hydroxyphenylpyruvate dioxygenase